MQLSGYLSLFFHVSPCAYVANRTFDILMKRRKQAPFGPDTFYVFQEMYPAPVMAIPAR